MASAKIGCQVRMCSFNSTLIDFTLPAFASMLPVRTVGALFTLRTGALVRCELTRDTKGNGWYMKRGTILVGNNNTFHANYEGGDGNDLTLTVVP